MQHTLITPAPMGRTSSKMASNQSPRKLLWREPLHNLHERILQCAMQGRLLPAEAPQVAQILALPPVLSFPLAATTLSRAGSKS